MQGWEELMMILESSMAGGRREVAVAAMAVLVSVMQAIPDTPTTHSWLSNKACLSCQPFHIMILSGQHSLAPDSQ